MRNAIRCCISCILPCGALDVIRIVHVDGRVEEIGGTVSAAEIMKAYPKHVLKKPTSRFPDEGADTTTTTPAAAAAPRILVVPPDAELKRGKIYFLIPVPSSSSKKAATSAADRNDARRRKKREAQLPPSSASENAKNAGGGRSNVNGANNTERYLSEVLREKVSTQTERRRGRVRVWRPRLESISESAVAAADLSGDQ